jgi:hypothetical protein
MAIHNLVKNTEVTHIKGFDELDNPPCANYRDSVYKNKPFEKGTIFLLAEIRQLLIKLVNK